MSLQKNAMLKHQKTRWYEYLGMIFIVFITQRETSFSVMLLISVALVVYSLFSSPTKIFYVVMFLMSNAENLLLGSLSIHVIIMAIYTGRVGIRLILNQKMKKANYFIFVFILILVGLIQMLYLSSNIQILATIKSIFFLVFMSDVLHINRNKSMELYADAMRMIGKGLISASFFSLLIYGDNLLSGRFYFGLNSTINAIGIQCAYVVVGLLCSFVSDINRLSLIDTFIIFACVMIGFLTRSRTSILMIGVGGGLILILALMNRARFRIFGTVVFVIIAALVVYISNDTVSGIVNAAFERFYGRTDISNGRYELWRQTLDGMKENAFFVWFGAGDYQTINAMVVSKVNVAHNFVLESYVIYGVLGILGLTGMFYSFIKKSIFANKAGAFPTHRVLYSYVPIVIMCVGLFYSHHFIGRVTSIVFILNFVPILNAKKKSEMSYI